MKKRNGPTVVEKAIQCFDGLEKEYKLSGRATRLVAFYSSIFLLESRLFVFSN